MDEAILLGCLMGSHAVAKVPPAPCSFVKARGIVLPVCLVDMETVLILWCSMELLLANGDGIAWNIGQNDKEILNTLLCSICR